MDLILMVNWFTFFLFAVGVFLFSFLCVLGSSLFALGSHFKGTPYLLPLMLTGRLLFGSGNGSLTSKATWQNSYPYTLQCQLRGMFTNHSLACVLVSCSEPHHSLLVQRKGAGLGFRSDPSFLSPWFSPELLPHPEVWGELWHVVDTLGR